MRKYLAGVVILVALLPLSSVAADTVTIPKAIPFAKGISVPDAVKAECHLPEKISQFIQEFAGKNMNVKMADNVSPRTPGKVLVMQITEVQGVAGGAFSGAKAISAEGTLYNGGKVIGSFKVVRHSGGGVTFGYKGTCSILGRCTKAIGRDVAEWLQSPTMNAKLGELK